MKAGIEIGFGAPYGWAISKEGNREFNTGGRVDNMKVSPNWRVGVIGGYGFPFLDDTLAIGPDIGLFLGTKRRFEISHRYHGYLEKVTLEEQYLHIPFALKLATVEKETGVQEAGLTLGYELNILLSHKCSLSDEHDPMSDQVESIAKSSRLGGSVFFGGKIDLFAGCYLMGQFKFPITDFLGLKDGDQNNDNVKFALHNIRVQGASLVELSLGFNIMKWL